MKILITSFYIVKQGFVFNVEDWVYDNIDYIASELENDSTIIKEYNKNILRDLSLFKTRMNGIRIWKLFALENFMKKVVRVETKNSEINQSYQCFCIQKKNYLYK